MTIITAAVAKQISFNSLQGFMELVNIAVRQMAEIGSTEATLTIPRSLYDRQETIRSELEAAGYEILIEVRQGCCMPDERVMYLNWGADYAAS